MRRLLLVGAVVALGAAVLPASGAPACAEPQRVESFGGRGTGEACTVRTGYLTGESHLRVAPDGTVVQQPAQTVQGLAGTGFLSGAPGARPVTQLAPGAFAVSRDGGKRFQRVLPAGLEWVSSDGAIHIDSATGRLYFYALSPSSVPQAGGVPVTDQVPAGYAHLMSSPDNGRTWTHTQAPGYVESENPRFTSGPTPKGGDRPVPGERIAYWCGNTVLFAYGQRDCYRTLDGGTSWQFRSTLLRRGLPAHPECGTVEEDFNATDGYYPQSGPDGSLWSLVACGEQTFLARSTDEAATFPVVHAVPAALRELRIDSKGILYGVTARLELQVSRNGGASWTRPVPMVAPAHRGRAIDQSAVALRGPGQLAIAYTSARPEGGFDGTVVLTRDARAAVPAFLTSTVHDGSRALVTSPQSARDDYIDLDVGPDGSAWASFYGDCEGDPACGTSDPNPLAKIAVLTHLG